MNIVVLLILRNDYPQEVQIAVVLILWYRIVSNRLVFKLLKAFPLKIYIFVHIRQLEDT